MVKSILATLQNALAAGAFPGAVCHLSRRGEVIFHQAVGNLGVEAPFGRTATRDTVYDLASLSKIYTLCAAFQVLRDAKIAFDAPLTRFLPGFDARITLRLLMAHASGISLALQRLEKVEAGDWMQHIVAAPLFTDPGREVSYCCTNFWLLARAVETIGGASLDSLIQGRILQPLQLENTHLALENRENVAPTERILDANQKLENENAPHLSEFFHGIVHDEAARSWRAQTGTLAGNAGIFASASDVARFAQIWARGAAGILHPEDAARAFEPLFPERDNFRGLGFQIDVASYMSEVAPKRSAGHLGFTGPSLVITPRSDVLVILNNRVHPTRNGPGRLSFHRQIAAQFFGEGKEEFHKK